MKNHAKRLVDKVPDRVKKYIVASVIIAMASQFYFDILIEDFRVSCGIIALGVVSINYRGLNQFFLGVFAGISVVIWRIMVLIIRGSFDLEIAYSYSIEIYFYALLGGMIYIYFRNNRDSSLMKYALNMVFFDFLTNIVEIAIRIQFQEIAFYIDIILYLFLTAISRSLAIYAIMAVLNHYKRLLKDVEHEERYKKLLWLNSMLKSEMYWMNKNMDKIETLMGESYMLYTELKVIDDNAQYTNRMLDITKDIHEIKKDHELVLRGMEDIIENKYKDNGMYLKDIMGLLTDKIELEIAHRNINVKLDTHYGVDFYTTKHFQIMSICRNLMINGLDSMEESKGKVLECRVYSEENYYRFEFIDTGMGIKDNDIANVFNPGFSTKIDYDTGKINRGLGLSVVKYMVEEHFQGAIHIESKIESGTTFFVDLKKSKVEE